MSTQASILVYIHVYKPYTYVSVHTHMSTHAQNPQTVLPLRGSCARVSGLCVPVGPLLHLVPLQYPATWETGWGKNQGVNRFPTVWWEQSSLYSEQPVGVPSALARVLLRRVCQETCWDSFQ